VPFLAEGKGVVGAGLEMERQKREIEQPNLKISQSEATDH
jgi:hypothetical protein